MGKILRETNIRVFNYNIKYVFNKNGTEYSVERSFSKIENSDTDYKIDINQIENRISIIAINEDDYNSSIVEMNNNLSLENTYECLLNINKMFFFDN